MLTTKSAIYVEYVAAAALGPQPHDAVASYTQSTKQEWIFSVRILMAASLSLP